MTEPEEPQVTDVPEPDQEPHEPVPDEADEEEESEVGVSPDDPVVPRDDAEIERAFSSLQKEATRHANRISQIMGEDANMLQPCPRCVTTDPQRPATPGFIWPHEMVPLLPADKAAVKLSIGEGAEPEYRSANDAAICDACDGWGKVKTGSRVNRQDVLDCRNCDGRGWIGPRAATVSAAPNNGLGELVTVGGGGDEPRPDSDPWGRLKDDPLYGVMPGFER